MEFRGKDYLAYGEKLPFFPAAMVPAARAALVKTCANGLSVRFLKLTTATGLTVVRSSIARTFNISAGEPEEEPIRQFLDLMRKGDTESAYRAVETMKVSDFVDALDAAQRQDKDAESPKTIGRRTARSTLRLRDMLDRAVRKYGADAGKARVFDEPII